RIVDGCTEADEGLVSPLFEHRAADNILSALLNLIGGLAEQAYTATLNGGQGCPPAGNSQLVPVANRRNQQAEGRQCPEQDKDEQGQMRHGTARRDTNPAQDRGFGFNMCG